MSEDDKEKVDHPSHYNAAKTLDEDGTSKYEVIKIIEDWGYGEGFCVGNALKYLLRASHKYNEIEDLKKAFWYLDRLKTYRKKEFTRNTLMYDKIAEEWSLDKFSTAFVGNMQVFSTLGGVKEKEKERFDYIKKNLEPLRKYIINLNIKKKYNEKKLVLFDLDDTLAESKQPIGEDMARKLVEMSERYIIGIISGASSKQMNSQAKIINEILKEEQYESFNKRSVFIYMPTCGTKIIKIKNNQIDIIHNESLTKEQMDDIDYAIEESGVLAVSPEQTWGDIVEHRESQVTISFLGQEAPPEEKKKWDPDKTKRKVMQKILQAKLPNYEVKFGGSTSIDITKKGVDKAYGVMKLLSEYHLDEEYITDDKINLRTHDIVFFGDALEEGGNDYPVRDMGVDSIDVSSASDCLSRLKTLFATQMDAVPALVEEVQKEPPEEAVEEKKDPIWEM